MAYEKIVLMGQRGMVLLHVLLGALVLVLLGAGGYYLVVRNAQPVSQRSIVPLVVSQLSPTPTIDPTANWKTYTNQQFGISFKYPNTVRIPTKNSYDDEIVGFISVNAPDNSIPIIDIRSLDNPTNLSIQAYNRKNYNTSAPGNSIYWPDLPNAQTITIGGKQAYSLQKSSCDPEFCDRYLISLPNKIIEIYRLTGDPNIMSDAESKPIFNTILSTFTFTNQNLIGCKTDNDCTYGESCVVMGPIVINKIVHKVCAQKGQSLPM